jgi:hypothetical protein
MSFIFSNSSFSKSKLLMTTEPSKAPPLYPKTHLLAAVVSPPFSAWHFWYSLPAMLKPKTTLSLELESPAEQLTQDQDAADASSHK